MFELLEKAVLTGLGALSLTQKKAEEILAELKEKYKLSEEEGKAFLDKVQGIQHDRNGIAPEGLAALILRSGDTDQPGYAFDGRFPVIEGPGLRH